jgi:hypothetical protein
MGCPTCQNQNNYIHEAHTPCIDCATPVCSTPQPCTEITDAQCTIYTGDNIKCGTDVVITKNDKVSDALSKVVTYFCQKQGLITTDAISCGNTVIIPVGTNMQTALELVTAFICNIQLTPGPQGTTGVQGIQGITGIQGIQGIVGSQGIQGVTGLQGLTGTGLQGTQGPAGSGLPATVGLFAQTEDSVPVTNATGAQSLIGNGEGILIIPANGFQRGDSFKGTLFGRITCANNQTLRIVILANGIQLASTPPMVIPQITNKVWELNLDFTIRSLGLAGVASIVSGGKFIYNKDSNSIFEGVIFNMLENTNFDTTVINTLEIIAEWQTVNAANTINSDMFTLFKTY